MFKGGLWSTLFNYAHFIFILFYGVSQWWKRKREIWPIVTDHIDQGYMKLCVNNNDDIVILNDLELDANNGELDIVMSRCIPDSIKATI